MNSRREQAEANYREKFEQLNLDGFEFIRREWSSEHDKRFWVRCKRCGRELLKNNDILRGKTKRLECRECGNGIECRSDFADEVLAYYTDKHTMKETCEKFGITKTKLSEWVKARGISNGRTRSEINAENAKTAAEKNIKQREQQIIEKALMLGFEYIEGYTRADCYIKVRCQTCGSTLKKSTQCFKDNKAVCPVCKKAESENRKAEAKKLKAIRAEKRAEELKTARAEKEKAANKKFDAIYSCKECGKDYTPRNYMKSKGLRLFSNPGFCCVECQKRFSRRKSRNKQKANGTYKKDTHRARCRRYGCPYDPSVTLNKLIEKKGLFCAICGRICIPEDQGWTKYIGPMSPTMDHIIPLAQKGGPGHVWGNVQVAHAMCNSCKSDKVRREDGKYETNKKSRRAKVNK